MSVQIYLEPAADECRFVPLAVVGYSLTRSGVLPRLWSGVQIEMKTRDHTPQEKLQDILVAILAGCDSLARVNTRLRPEVALATAWQRSAWGEQSTLSRTLDAVQPEQIDQLRAGNLALVKQYSQVRQHPRDQLLMLDVDPTSLITSKHAEGSRKGGVSGKKTATAAMLYALPSPAITKALCHLPIRGIGTATNTSSPLYRPYWNSGRGDASPTTRSLFVATLNKAPMKT